MERRHPILNRISLTLSEEAIDFTCSESSDRAGAFNRIDCEIEYAPGIFF